MWNRRHRWLRRFAGTLAFAALVVPTAQAKVIHNAGIVSDEQAEYNGYGYQHGTGVPIDQQNVAVRPAPGNPQVKLAVHPDGRADRVTPGNPQVILAVHPDGRADRFTPEAGNPQFVAAPSTGFDWSDAGIGAGMAVGLMLLGLGAGLATRHLSRKTLANT